MRISIIPRMLPLLAVLMFLLSIPAAFAATLPIYSEDTIREWEPEFRAAVEDNYTRLFKPRLNSREAPHLRTLRFEFPTAPEQVLFQFHSRSDGGVVLPVASLLLLKDLAAAQVWLEANGYSPQTLLDYLAIVRRGRLDSWPAAERLPLAALGVPADAMGDSHLLERRNEILDKTLFFILGHELGHLLQDFSPQQACRQNRNRGVACDLDALRKSETRADAFAVDMFRRIGLVPSASNFFFAIHSRLAPMPFEFKDHQAWRAHAEKEEHPLDSTRIRNVAALIDEGKNAFAGGFSSPAAGALRIDKTVGNLKVLADMLDDRDLAGMQIAWAQSLNHDDIKPRRSHQPKLRPGPADLAAAQPWTGFFTGKAHYADGGEASLEVILRRVDSGSRIHGEVMLNGIRGRLEGYFENTSRAVATWTVAGDTYRLAMLGDAAPGHLDAYYHSTAGPARGSWTLKRRAAVE